jgi:dihydrofolate synthase / folylpolyglutamate synthase
VTYKQALEYMLSNLPMFSRIGPAAFKKDLTNTLALCEHLHNPHTQFDTIHIAGTNGKGSVSHILSAALQSAGLKTGLYTSPHYKDFRERIKCNGQYMPKRQVSLFIQENQHFLNQLKPSYFEMAVGMAFDYFAKQQVDVAVIETGLGGRLDSTNIINPLISIITNISLDHTDMLGPDIPSIAGEKAGIIKAHTPVLIGEFQEETAPIFDDKSRQENAPLHYAHDLVSVKITDAYPGGMNLKIELTNPAIQLELTTDLYGFYQEKNIRTSLAALCLLHEKIDRFILNDFFLKKFIPNIKSLSGFIGRMQWISTHPMILADSAHNEAGIDTLMQELDYLSFNKLHIVFGTVSDKSPDKILDKLPRNAIYYFAKANIPRGMDASQLKTLAEAHDLSGMSYNSVSEAFKTARKNMKSQDLLLVCGSIFVVAEVI